MKRSITLPLSAIAAALVIMSVGLRAAEPTPEQTKAMQGTWALEKFVLNGNEVDAEQLKSWRRVVENDHVTWTLSNGNTVETDMKYDPSQTPMTLDTTFANGDEKGRTTLAIYELKDDVLRVCFADFGKARPSEFSSEPGSGQHLFVARRIAP
jgi:uncharacterized protein (TIGR03067 family)